MIRYKIKQIGLKKKNSFCVHIIYVQMEDIYLGILNTISFSKLKLGFESESLSFTAAEIILHTLSLYGHVPTETWIKIGGCNSRAELKQITFHPDGILCPMIESKYALQNFIAMIDDFEYNGKLGILIETKTGYEKINEIINSKEIERISQIEIGRSDLSKSFDIEIESIKLYNIMKTIKTRAKQRNKEITVGGKINTINCLEIQKKINPDFISTKLFSIRSKNNTMIEKNILSILKLEKFLLQSILIKNNMCYKNIQDRVLEIDKIEKEEL